MGISIGEVASAAKNLLDAKNDLKLAEHEQYVPGSSKLSDARKRVDKRQADFDRAYDRYREDMLRAGLKPEETSRWGIT